MGEQYESIPKAVFGALRAGDDASTGDDSEVFNQWYRITMSGEVTSDAELLARPPPVDTQAQALAFAARCAKQLAGRRGFFFSRDGHIGSGPPDTTDGDMIFVINGVRTPMILREIGAGSGRYKVLGAAFVCGMMDLETFKPGEDGRQWQNVVLV